jgi:hypothetical protein
MDTSAYSHEAFAVGTLTLCHAFSAAAFHSSDTNDIETGCALTQGNLHLAATTGNNTHT